ncbi:hypothetical protein F4776DRAFT_340579 [Hypoxylon sp. NC0597]|nr:hypothetical protein F4776DRAFT_340579 [Hypoxylon sp. NC0597]
MSSREDETGEGRRDNSGNSRNRVRRFVPTEQVVSANGSEEMSQPELEVQACACCTEMKYVGDLVTLPCGHRYCHRCIRQLFMNAVMHEALFPPRCCQLQIHLEAYLHFLGEDLVRLYRAKAVEFATPQRVYCHRPECSVFIPPANYTDNIGLCHTCQNWTCTICKGRAHTGDDCPRDEGLQRLLEVARENGWRRCPGCQTMIERRGGCYHVTCLCGAQFCFMCTRTWGICDCEWVSVRGQRHLYGQPAHDVLAARGAGTENPYYHGAVATDSGGEDSDLEDS